MSERVGAAKRRRDRRLRAWRRRVRLAVAMELAAALHHSAQRPKTVVDEPKEEVENVTRRTTDTEHSTFGVAAASPAGSRAAVG